MISKVDEIYQNVTSAIIFERPFTSVPRAIYLTACIDKFRFLFLSLFLKRPRKVPVSYITDCEKILIQQCFIQSLNSVAIQQFFHDNSVFPLPHVYLQFTLYGHTVFWKQIYFKGILRKLLPISDSIFTILHPSVSSAACQRPHFKEMTRKTTKNLVFCIQSHWVNTKLQGAALEWAEK